ncbi:hypothetical protein Taro_041407 [Colocasia esculenta]|uniref:Uncharacterized protein n=1 Tax=Colocasia esculenta TaxID=4460 RepID=A0A843X0G9_COLES|nr:hypothetical protein [Colocasia esculenta]
MPNRWLVTHDKPNKREARTDPQVGCWPTKAHTSKSEPRNTIRNVTLLAPPPGHGHEGVTFSH